MLLEGATCCNVVTAASLLTALTGCADYLNHYDTVTLAAGDTQKANLMLQRVDPFNPNSLNTNIPTDGRRTADVMAKYRQHPAAGPPVKATMNSGGARGDNPCDYRGQIDRAGNPCGKRAADDRPGGEDPPGGNGQ